MSKGHLALLIAVVVAGNLLSSPALAQQGSQSGAEEDTWTVPLTPDGRPVLQCYWTTQTFTPMERPEYLGDQAFYSEEEWAELQAQLTVDGADPLARHVITIAAVS